MYNIENKIEYYIIKKREEMKKILSFFLLIVNKNNLVHKFLTHYTTQRQTVEALAVVHVRSVILTGQAMSGTRE